jgi:hypothetical protein
MKRIACLGIAALLTMTSAAFAQGPGPAAGPVTVAGGLQAGYTRIKGLLTQSADKLSEADYTFKPTAEIRDYGQLWAHVAGFHYQICSQAKGVPNPNQGINLEMTLMGKAAFVKALADSFAFCDDAFSAVTDANASEVVAGGRGPGRARAALLWQVVEHDNEMYGIGTVYQRLKGVVPPSTEAQQNRGGGAGRQGGGQGGGRQGGGRGN